MLGLFARMTLSLALVLLLLWVAARLMHRKGLRGSGPLIEVLARAPLNRSASVAVVRIAGRAVIVGCTDQQVQLLGEADLSEMARSEAQERTPVLLPTSWRPRGGDPEQSGDGSDGVAGSALAGSVLSPDTWRQAVQVLREKSVRRA